MGNSPAQVRNKWQHSWDGVVVVMWGGGEAGLGGGDVHGARGTRGTGWDVERGQRAL